MKNLKRKTIGDETTSVRLKYANLGQRWLGDGDGSVGRAVASDTRNPRFESQHWQNFTYQLYIQIVEEKS